MSSFAERVSFGTGVPTSAAARAWDRFRLDRVALAAGIFVLLVFFMCFIGEPLAVHLLGHGPNDQFAAATNVNLKPVGPWTRIDDPNGGKAFFLLGGGGPLGRDEFLRLLIGGRTSLEIALLATLLAIVVGTTLGSLAGFYGGWIDGGVTRMTEFVMGFPILFFVVVIGMTISDRLNNLTVHGLFVPGVVTLVVLIGLFNWFYIARIVRAQVISLREQEFVEAARMTGASDLYIVRKHILPHLTGSIIVYGSLVIATTMMLEAALSFLNVGIKLPYASWGNMLSTNWGTLLVPGGQEDFAQHRSMRHSVWR